MAAKVPRQPGTASLPEVGTGAESAPQAARLNSRLTAEAIAGGHSFEKHVATQGETLGFGHVASSRT
jgi:hypothetical protein